MPRAGLRSTLLATAVASVVAASAMIMRAQAAPQVVSSDSTGVVDVNTNLGYQAGTAAGTGIVVSGSGEVLTNNHVIRGATSLHATVVGTGRTYTATVLGYSVASDVAVIKLNGASGLKTASLGKSGSLKVGQSVTAVGNAGGLGGAPSVTTGHVTALHRAITVVDGFGGSERLTDLIKSSASVQPGDSGGPLLDAAGHVVGVTTAAAGGFRFENGGTSGYAIPIDDAMSLAGQILAKRSSANVHVGPTAFLGVLTHPTSEVTGALIQAVVPGSAADKAGINEGDVITGFNGRTVGSAKALTAAVLSIKPGTRVQVRWLSPSGVRFQAFARPAAGPPQ
ncbi:MAG TPA: trypsin-like peptidase domain-containing protein [Gaiellaceae bacterium]|nr:trypsin-like peptidase domain-containing protein [Gaiellaceae bacterium]